MLARLSGKRKLHCSFCGKSESDVARLMSGAEGHICDACVGVCNEILKATPPGRSGWSEMSDEELLSGLSVAEATVEATRSVLQAQIDELRKRGISWDRVGKALGISRQAAWERFS